MTPHGTICTGKNHRGAWLVGLLLLGSASCHAPPARHQATLPCAPKASQMALLLKQLLEDSLVQIICNPLEFTHNFCKEPMVHLRAAGTGMWCKHLVPPFLKAPEPLADARESLDPDKLDEEMHELSGKRLQPAQVEIYPDGTVALENLRDLIDRATCSLDILMFQWENDCIGEELAQRVAARAGPHLRVRVLIDGGGNLVFGHPEEGRKEVNKVVCWLAQQPYVEVIRTRNPFARFDHRKLVLVDGKLAWTGGRNFSHLSFFGQHDVSLTLRGPLVDELQEHYHEFWCEQGGSKCPPIDVATAPPNDPVQVVTAVTTTEPAPELAVNAWARLVFNLPPKLHLANAMYLAVDSAKHHVYVENPYFADTLMVWKLIKARRRGVDVRVVLTIQSDCETINHSNRATANRLLKAGIRVYLYPQNVHMKALSVDGCWAYLGTGNCDPLSLRHNRELGLAVGAGPLIEEIDERVFHTDFRPDWEMHEAMPLSLKDYLCEILANVAL
jgi:cardiolipin synthase